MILFKNHTLRGIIDRIALLHLYAYKLSYLPTKCLNTCLEEPTVHKINIQISFTLNN